MSKYSLSALVAAGLLAGGMSVSSSSSAFAADLGGNCCADLEERIAELEATTARKGNRKVSLTISGWVSQQVMWWDDGGESNVYITDTGSVSIGTHVKFSGQATIVPGWSAGYVLNLEAIQNDSLLVNQGHDNGIANNAMAAVANGPGANAPVAIESSYWFVKSDQLGKVSVGKQSSAADNQAILPDGSGTLVVANYVMYDVNAFALRNKRNGGFNSGGLTNINWGSIASCYPLNGGGGVAGDCDGYPDNQVRYDSPTYAGFSMSASWGEDDSWAVSGRYAGEWHDFKVSAAVAYNENTDENGPGGLNRPSGFEGSAIQTGAYIEHIPTGLFVYGAYSKEFVDSHTGNFYFDNKPEGNQWYLKAGIRQHWNPLGHTVLFGEYGQNNDRMTAENFSLGMNDSRLRQFGVGLVQEIDAAAMSVWIGWRHYEGDVTCSDQDPFPGNSCTRGGIVFGPGLGLAHEGKNSLEDMDIVKAGALINF